MESSKFYKALGIKLKEARENCNMSQSTAAEKLGVSRSCIGNYEQGTRAIYATTLIDLCNLYNVDMNVLVKDIRHLVWEK